MQHCLNQEVHFYQFQKNVLQKTVITGLFHGNSSKDVPHRYFIFEADIPYNTEARLVFSIGNKAEMVTCPIQIFSEKNFNRYVVNDALQWGLLCSAWLAIIILSLVIYFIFKYKPLLSYAIYVGCMLLFQLCVMGYMFEYILPNSPKLLLYIRVCAYVLAIFFLFKTVSKILVKNRAYDSYDRILNALGWANIMTTLAILLCSEQDKSMLHILVYIHAIILFLSIVFLIIFLIHKGLRQQQHAFWILAGFAPLILYFMAIILSDYKLIHLSPGSTFYLRGVPYCAAIEIFSLFAMAMVKLKEFHSINLSLQTELLQLKARLSQDQESTISKTSTDKELLEHIYGLLENTMRSQKLYLKKRLSLTELSEEISVSPHLLSETINTLTHGGFNDYINMHRVKHACTLLDHDTGILSIEGIGLESGFTSKSTFYVAFKKVYDQTPKEYLKNKISADHQN